ncbi:MAG: hypothetical protein R3286_19755 [Gammaproteobacteria bacterium]|nr:hypothetical protein [Gammaproteobacteria bacterium]
MSHYRDMVNPERKSSDVNWSNFAAAAGGSASERPSEAQLRRDIRHFERQIARLGAPASPWEQGALKCYQVLVQQRRKILDDLRAGSLSGV